MPKYTIIAKSLNTYEIEVEATDAAAAIASLDEWNSEDFEDFLVNGQWDIEAY
jgi:hypothetical protein